MKTYKQIIEEIGLSTGIGLAGIDLPLGTPLRKRKFNGYNNDIQLGHTIHNIFEALGICKDCMRTMVLIDGKLTCEKCKKQL